MQYEIEINHDKKGKLYFDGVIDHEIQDGFLRIETRTDNIFTERHYNIRDISKFKVKTELVVK